MSENQTDAPPSGDAISDAYTFRISVQPTSNGRFRTVIGISGPNMRTINQVLQGTSDSMEEAFTFGVPPLITSAYRSVLRK